MKIRYFKGTDSLYIEFRSGPVAETHDVGEDMLFDYDAEGNICSITVEHAQKRVDDLPNFAFELK
jgi:YD repeat-containing protein